MAVKINFNEAAAQTHTALISNERAMGKSLLRLSTGVRILNAADDSAGLFIADMLGTVAKAYEQGNRNIQTGISALQIAEASAGKIYDKLQDIYVRAQNAANDINDPNARQALQREINNFVDAIQKIGTDTEYNGIKLLDGTFTGKYIHYGPRADQVVNLSVSDLRATELGAYIVQGAALNNERAYSSGTDAYSALVSNTDLQFATSETVTIGTVSLTGSNLVTDAKYFADWINNNPNLQAAGVSAMASNRSVASSWTDITVASGNTVTINFYSGTGTTSVASYTANAGQTITLDELITAINSQAAANGSSLKAVNEGGKLVLQTNGETIGVQVSINQSGTNSQTIALGQFLEGATASVTSSSGTTVNGSAILVGRLTIAGVNQFTYNFDAVSGNTAPKGLALSAATGTAGKKNLYQIDVTTNAGAEEGIMVVTKALQKTDTVRAQIGATMNNLQSIFDSQKTAYDNTKEAESVIRNTDYAKEMAEFTTYQIRMQATVAMLGQANTLPQLVLQLLR
ncbi:flagellin [Caldimicrobium thiodismutans]|uniref:Flagellin n=1 Tax=Caldimicrobium thiodismutans TaxID=1653476 RepID=A0A0U4W1P8_9BACT|nr:flagellin [Caldimicrobium thiodismutans]BAU23053.1 flagellin [Caldimicrobium thiodismutans]